MAQKLKCWSGKTTGYVAIGIFCNYVGAREKYLIKLKNKDMKKNSRYIACPWKHDTSKAKSTESKEPQIWLSAQISILIMNTDWYNKSIYHRAR